MKKIFRSKVDIIIILLIGILFFLPIIPLISDFSLVDLLIYIFIFLFFLMLLFSIKFVVDDKVLEIKYFFFFSEKINIDEIISIK